MTLEIKSIRYYSNTDKWCGILYIDGQEILNSSLDAIMKELTAQKIAERAINGTYTK